jgi:hypothetical protein
MISISETSVTYCLFVICEHPHSLPFLWPTMVRFRSKAHPDAQHFVGDVPVEGRGVG